MFSLFFFFFKLRSTSAATRNSRTSAAIHGSRTLHLARDVMQLLVYLVPTDGTIRQGFTLLPDSNHTCSHDVTLRIPKANLAL